MADERLKPEDFPVHTEQMKIVKNDVNRFIVCTLHYTADPSKRSKDWQAEAKAGMSPARWDKEYEIDYVALYGQRVFPEIAANPPHARIVAKPKPPRRCPSQVLAARNNSRLMPETVTNAPISRNIGMTPNV